MAFHNQVPSVLSISQVSRRSLFLLNLRRTYFSQNHLSSWMKMSLFFGCGGGGWSEGAEDEVSKTIAKMSYPSDCHRLNFQSQLKKKPFRIYAKHFR